MRASHVKELAESFTGQPCVLKQVHGRCGIFLNNSATTAYHGGTWKKALTQLLHLYKPLEQSLQSEAAPDCATETSVVVPDNAPQQNAV